MWIKNSRPDVYERIGEMGEEELDPLRVSGFAAEIRSLSWTTTRTRSTPGCGAESPVAWVPAVGMWLATSWDAAVRGGLGAGAVRRGHARFADRPQLRQPDDPHLRRRAAPRAARGRSIRKYRPRAVEEYIDELVEPIVAARLDALTDEGEADLMADFFEPVSVRSLGEVLGLGDVDDETLRRWFAALADGATNFEGDAAKQERSDAACAEIEETIAPTLERLEREPDDSTISHMIHSGVEPRGRPRDAIMPSLKVILLGGMQEPGHGPGSVLYALLTHEDAMERSGPTPSCCRAGDRGGHALDLSDRHAGQASDEEGGARGRRAAGGRPGRRCDRGGQSRPRALLRAGPVPPRS